MPNPGGTSGEVDHGIVLPQWEFGADAGSIVAYAVAAEAAGWDGVFLADHLVFPPADELKDAPDTPGYEGFADPWITLAAIAAETERIRLVSWVTPLPRRQPWQLARNLATLDRLSDGRVTLGTGLGRGTDYVPFGRSYDLPELGRRYDEALDVMEGLWRGEPFSYDGDHFTLEEATVLPTPVQEPRIPIVVGGLWPHRKPIQRGARWDGIVPHYPGDGIHPDDPDEATPEEEVRSLLEYYRECTDEPGEVFLPADPPHAPDDWIDRCANLGATWLYTTNRDPSGEWHVDIETIRAGPPA